MAFSRSGRAVAQAVTGFPQKRPGLEPRSGHVGFVVDKVALGQVSPANSHSTDCSTFIIYHPGLIQQAS
jgi:hypothetical protein